MIKFLSHNSAGWLFLMSDDSTKPTEVTPAVVAVVKPEVEEAAVKLSPDEAQAWLEKSEKFVKLVAEKFAIWESDEVVCDDRWSGVFGV